MKKMTKVSWLWRIATILEWVNVILFIAAMGYDYIDFSLFNSLKNWKYINILFYICATLDALLFGILVKINKKTDDLKSMGIAVYCCLIQIILIIVKVKW